jgi:thiol-disulfide isomerase/thioredoxin
MNNLIILLSVTLLLLIIIRYYGSRYEGFEGNSGSKQVIICKADWCGHCKNAAPEFQKLVSASPITLKDGSTAVVKILDADKDKSEIGKYKVRGFPTILIADGSKITEYPGDRTASGVINYLNTQ